MENIVFVNILDILNIKTNLKKNIFFLMLSELEVFLIDLFL